jgi:hypothetical protein
VQPVVVEKDGDSKSAGTKATAVAAASWRKDVDAAAEMEPSPRFG